MVNHIEDYERKLIRQSSFYSILEDWLVITDMLADTPTMSQTRKSSYKKLNCFIKNKNSHLDGVAKHPNQE